METNLLNGRTFTSLEHLNEMAMRWLAETADVRIHRETKRRPIDLPSAAWTQFSFSMSTDIYCFQSTPSSPTLAGHPVSN